MVSNSAQIGEHQYQEAFYSRFAIRLGGTAGDGLKSTSLVLQKFFNRLGYYVHGFHSVQSTIRGGHTWMQAEFSSKPVRSIDNPVDLLFAFNSATLDIHLQDVKINGFLFYNSDKVTIDNYREEIERKYILPVGIPITHIAKNIDKGASVLANTVAIGAIIELLNLQSIECEATIVKQYKNKGDLLSLNIKALSSGIQFYRENYKTRVQLHDPTLEPMHRLVSTGNHMISLGAVASGLKFFAQYPITPASSILTYLAKRASKFHVVVKQVEDEISAISMCIGAAFAGARAMTATSGPGISLMAESFGYAAMTETPIVVVCVMRAGPSTGIATKTEQADLDSVLHLSHGEAPRAILAPRNVEEAFEVTTRAFNIADRFQMPVIILSDFALSERAKNIEPVNVDVSIDRGKIWKEPSKEFPTFKRFQFTNDGISPRAFPPTDNAMHVLVGAEHDESSHSLSGNRSGLPQSQELRKKMFEKRFKKYELLRSEMNPPTLYGPENADYTILCWGSTQGAMMEAIDRLNSEEDRSWNMFSFVDLSPFPYNKIRPIIDRLRYSIIFEVNYTGQLENLIHKHLDWRPNDRIHSLSGENPTPSSIINEIRELLNFHK